MLQSLKLWKLSGALKRRGHVQDAYSAVLELGRIGTEQAVDMLIGALSRHDGVARSAARELGRLGNGRAVQPLAGLLSVPEVNQSAAEALVKLGKKSLNALITALQSENATVRKLAATTLGEIGDKAAVEPLIEVMQNDNEYSVRTVTAKALGELKDERAIWVLVGTLKLRDETTPERQAALEELRTATTLAMRKIGDPLSAKAVPQRASAEAAVEELEKGLREAEVHPRLIGDIGLLTNAELVSVLKELISASEEISWANLERREPFLPVWFRTYDQRRQTAEMIGAELHRRGGTALTQEILARDLNNYAAISNWWAGPEEWQS
jgi:HEAT repeat protein